LTNNYVNNETKDEGKTLNSKYHTMFIEDISERKELVEDTTDTYKITPAHKKYRIFIDSFMEFERGLHEIFNTLWNADESDELELRINSWGGIVKEGQNFYNIINNKFPGRTTTILDSAGYSMGALTFCMGDKRIATEACDLMFHDYSGGAGGKGGEIEAQVKHTAKHLRNFFKKVIVENGFLTKKEFKQMIVGQDYWMEVDELCKRGIATHVLVGGEEIPAKKYLKMKAKENGKKKKGKK
jgi:ATP-dependent protease ClpP protease subunit